MKKIAILFAIVVAGFTSQASYLYWTVDQSYTLVNTGATSTYNGSDDYAFNSARVMYYTTGGDITKATQVGTAGTPIDIGEGEIYTFTTDLSGLASAESYSYYIELVSNANGVVGMSQSMTYEQLNTAGMIYSTEGSPLTPVAAAVWHGTPMNAPEPTSALLMLLGVAGLALKRKQRKAE